MRSCRRRTVSRLCANTSGVASITVAMSRSPPLKSVGSTSTPHPGTASRTARMVAAQILAPPSVRSSRATPVRTTKRSPSLRTADAMRAGSSSSTGSGRAVMTSQNPQRRVQRSPRIRNVASRASQHSPMFGHIASSQTVWRSRSRMIDLSSAWFGPAASLTFNHGGLRASAGERSAVIRPPAVRRIGGRDVVCAGCDPRLGIGFELSPPPRDRSWSARGWRVPPTRQPSGRQEHAERCAASSAPPPTRARAGGAPRNGRPGRARCRCRRMGDDVGSRRNGSKMAPRILGYPGSGSSLTATRYRRLRSPCNRCAIGLCGAPRSSAGSR